MDYISREEVAADIKSLVDASSRVKTQVVKERILRSASEIMGVLGLSPSRQFLKLIKPTLDKYATYGRSVQQQMRTVCACIGTSGRNGSVVGYTQALADLVYGKADYAYAVMFLAGIKSGLATNRFSKATDVRDERILKTIKASVFPSGSNETVATLVENEVMGFSTISEIGSMVINSADGPYHTEQFKRLANYPQLINAADPIVAYRGAETVTKAFVEEELPLVPLESIAKNELIIAMINETMETAVYAIAMYVVKAAVFGWYCESYDRAFCAVPTADAVQTTANVVDAITDVVESVGDNLYTKVADRGLRTMDSIGHSDELPYVLRTFRDFVSSTGVDPGSLSDATVGNHNQFKPDANIFSGKLANHPDSIMDFLDRFKSGFHTTSETELIQYHHIITYNFTRSLTDGNSNENDVLWCIRTEGKVNSTVTLREVATDLYKFAFGVGQALRNILESIDYCTSSWYNNSVPGPLMTNKYKMEIGDRLGTFYTTFMSAVRDRFRELDAQKYNLGIPHHDDDDAMFRLDYLPEPLPVHHNAIVKTSLDGGCVVHDPKEIANEIMIAEYYDYIHLRHMYLGSLDIFKEDAYFTEDFADIKNKFIAALKGILGRIINFFTKSMDPAVKWVKLHEDKLKKLEFNTDASITYVPYKVDMNAISQHIEKMKTADRLKLPESLYPDGTYDEFDKNREEAVKKLTNKWIYSVDGTGDIERVKVTRDKLPTAVNEWMDSLLKADEVGKKLEGLRPVIDNIIDTLNKANEEPKETQTGTQTKPQGESFHWYEADETAKDDKKIEADAGTDKKETTTGTDKEAEKTADDNKDMGTDGKTTDGKTDPNAARIGKIKNVVPDIIQPISEGIIDAIKHDYNCLKQAWDIAINK